jgi:hypothetical protein
MYPIMYVHTQTQPPANCIIAKLEHMHIYLDAAAPRELYALIHVYVCVLIADANKRRAGHTRVDKLTCTDLCCSLIRNIHGASGCSRCSVISCALLIDLHNPLRPGNCVK